MWVFRKIEQTVSLETRAKSGTQIHTPNTDFNLCTMWLRRQRLNRATLRHAQKRARVNKRNESFQVPHSYLVPYTLKQQMCDSLLITVLWGEIEG